MIEPGFQPDAKGGGAWFVNHLPTILWQRRIYIAACFVLCLAAAAAAAYALPTMYRSSATFVLESQDVPTDVVEAAAADQITERIARIREQVLSRGDLIRLIEQNDLYSADRRSNPLSYVVDKMRRATTVGARAGDIGQSSSAKNDVIALSISFDYSDPEKAQAVMQSYVTQFLQMDSQEAQDSANLTVQFLQDQASKIQAKVADIEGQITALKAANGSALAGSGGPTFVDTGSYTAQIANLENQNRQLVAQSSAGSSDPELAQAEQALATARATYSDSHPDVVQARARLEQLKRLRASSGSGSGNSAVQEQLKANNAAIASLTAARENAVARANAAAAGQARAPAILEQAAQLENQASGLREQLRAVSSKLLSAQNRARLINEQRGERLSLVEPPNLPDDPQWPNRPLFILAGAAAGLMLGLALALLLELLNRPVRSPQQIHAMGLPILGVVPVLDSTSRKKRRWPFLRRKQSETRFAL